MARLGHYGPTGDADNSTRYSAGESNTGLPDDFSFHYRRMENNLLDLRYGPSGVSGSDAKNPTYRRFYIRVRRLPTVDTVFWFNGGNIAPSVAALQLIITSTGVVKLYNLGNQVFPGELIGTGTLGTVVLGQWHEIKVASTFETNTGLVCHLSGCGLATAQLDSDPVVSGQSFVDFLGNPNSGVGIGDVQSGYRDGFGRLESNSPSLDIDYSNIAIDDAAIPTRTRISAIKVAGAGTYAEWTTAGLTQWQARNTWPGVKNAQGGTQTGIQTTSSGLKQAYLMETLASQGVTGAIYSAVAHIEFAQAPASVPDLIVIHNGVETITAAYNPTANFYLRYRLDTTGWASTDTIELGIRSTSAAAIRIAAILLSVEHDTAVPTITIGDIVTQEVTWTGNGTTQTVTLPAAPQWIWWWPRASGTRGGFWAAEANNNQFVASPGACDPNFIVRGTNLYLVGAQAGGANVNAAVYDALVVSDPKMRMICGGAYAEVNAAGRDDLAVAMLDPFGVPFAPLTLLAIPEVVNTTTFIRYYGPGIVGDASLPLTSDSAATADYIQALTATGFTAGLSLHQDVQQTFYVGFRRANFNQLFLMDATSYVGNGAGGTRVIPVSLSGLVVKWALVVPLSTNSRIMRNHQHANGKSVSGAGATVLNSIEALGVDSITVGIDLNATGKIYSVLVFGYGTDPAPAPISIVECLHGSSVALLELSGSHTETFKALGSYRDTLTLEAGYRATLTSTGSLTSAITGLTGSL